MLMILGCACAATTHTPAAPTQPGTPPPGFVALFDGRSLAGWQAPTDHWRADSGVLANDGAGSNLVSTKSFGDFELLIDWKVQAKGDSGIYLRGLPQVQLWDPDNADALQHGADKGSGALWNNVKAGNRPAVRADRPVGQWNALRVRMVGELVWVWLNGKLVVDRVALENYKQRDKPAAATGPIELQAHTQPTWFRNVYVRDIPYDEAMAALTATDERDFKSLWNGRDFSDWDGPLDNYEIVDGAIRCKPGKGGTIYAKQSTSDFVARLEFKLPPGGNNGLAIRYPGAGDTAYDGMCELQVLDSESPKYATLDARQFHGSAYGQVAAHRGYLRPVGEWNFEQVTVRGSTIKVELNGTTILDADLSKVTEFMNGKAHPGKDRTSGFFGVAGHNDPVMFRSLRIKHLRASN